MSTRRTKQEMLELDDRIRPLYEQGVGCRVIATSLGENPVTIYKRVKRMGLVRSVEEAAQVAPSVDIPFSRKEADTNLSASAIGIAIRWFMQRGYVPSIPVEPTQYDLVVESDKGFQKIQVKSTTARNPQSGCWVSYTSRSTYDRERESSNANGKRKRTPYSQGEIDLFFIVTGEGDLYLIPLEATGSALSINLDNKYAQYKL